MLDPILLLECEHGYPAEECPFCEEAELEEELDPADEPELYLPGVPFN